MANTSSSTAAQGEFVWTLDTATTSPAGYPNDGSAVTGFAVGPGMTASIFVNVPAGVTVSYDILVRPTSAQTWYKHPDYSAQTATKQVSNIGPVRGIAINVNSITGGSIVAAGMAKAMGS